MARTRIPLLHGELTISTDLKRHAEERSGEVPALTIGPYCIAWWSKEALRNHQDRRAQARAERDRQWATVIEVDRSAGNLPAKQG